MMGEKMGLLSLLHQIKQRLSWFYLKELLPMSDVNSDNKQFIADSPSLLSQLNWQAANNGEQSRKIAEYPLYSDAHITSEIADGFGGPYAFLNTVPIPDGPGNVNAPIIVRVSFHIDTQSPGMLKTSETLYHGGLLIDELAALTSLCLGARIQAGGESRHFEEGRDPLGRPMAWNDQPKPTVRVRTNRIILPTVVGTHSLDQLGLFSTIPSLTSSQYVSLIRACNHYQDALWVAESEPNLAWLMFVSALETAAGEFNSTYGSPEERMRYSKPEVVNLLEEAGGSELVTQISSLIEQSLGATKKFIDFTLQFLPSEPKPRPEPKWLRVDWSKSSLKKNVLSKVYSYRSRALHGGIPFPAPMLDPPFYIKANSAPSETPLTGLATSSRGGTWLPKDLPINLHCFHYIVCGALMQWWKSMAG